MPAPPSSHLLPLPASETSKSPSTAKASVLAANTVDRILGLEYLRVFATFLVVVLHAAIPYLVWKMPGLAWPVHDHQPSPLVDGVFWAIECFIMPLFFIMSGMTAAILLQRKSVSQFLDHRRSRLLYPLIFGICVILPLDLYSWVLGWVSEGRYSVRKMISLKFEPEDRMALSGLSHLWFLQYLLIYSVGLAGYASCSNRWSFGSLAQALKRGFNAMISRWWGPVLLVLPCWALQWITPRITIGFRHDFLPFATNLAYYALWFAVGVGWKTGLPHASFWVRNWRASLVVCSFMFVGLLPGIHNHIASGEDAGLQSAAVTLLIPMYGWLASAGLLGLFLAIRFPNSKTIESLSRACFWVYLFHHPVVGLFQTGFDQAPVATEWKLVLVTLGTLFVSLGLYYTIIQKTWIEALLNGKRKALKIASPPVSEREAKSEPVVHADDEFDSKAA